MESPISQEFAKYEEDLNHFFTKKYALGQAHLGDKQPNHRMAPFDWYGVQ
jgi:hypothetical protein